MSGDTFIRRDGDDYAEAFARLLPTGEAWSRDPDGCLMQLVRGQAEIWGAVVEGALQAAAVGPQMPTYSGLVEGEREVSKGIMGCTIAVDRIGGAKAGATSFAGGAGAAASMT